METSLNINRITLLLKRYFIENKQKEITFWGIATLVFMVMHQAGSVDMFLYISGFIFASRTFKSFSYTPSGMHYLLIPATHFEKLTVTILLSIVYYFAMFLITYTIGTFIGINVGNLIFQTNNPINFELFNIGANVNNWNDIDISRSSLLTVFMTFTIIQSIFILGSVYFKRSTIGRTFLSIAAISIVLGLIELLFIKLTFGTYHFDNQMVQLNITGGQDLFNGYEIVGKVLQYITVPFLWVVSYFRLTEKEV